MGGADRGLTEQAAGIPGRQTAVLVARVSGNENPLDTSSVSSRTRCIEALVQAAEITGGRVLRKQRDVVLVLLSTSDAAVAAAARMQAYIASEPCKNHFAVKIGFAAGSVTQDRHDVLGDTVTLALQFSREAKAGQILTSEATATTLSPRVLTAVTPAAGHNGDPGLREVRWREASTQILAAHKEAASRGSRLMLRLEYRGKVLWRRREWEYITLGRDPGLDIVVAEKTASRRHCSVTRHEVGFALRDHSTNGTFVMLAGEGEIHLHADQCVLGQQGWISLGESGDVNAEVIHYQILSALLGPAN